MRSRFFLSIGMLSVLLFACERPPEVVFESPSRSSSSASSQRLEVNAEASSNASFIQQQMDPVTIPGSVLIKMVFAPQAPHANWDEPYQEACEEASLIIVHHYLTGAPLSREDADREILAMVAWENEHFGGYEDTTAAQVKQIAEEHLGRSAEVTYDPTIEDIKQQLARGNPVIVPAAGRDLGNPYFSGEGPWYHMLVIVGYDEDEFVTHDVGTRRGENYRYGQQVLYDAIHDWTGVKEEIRSGRKAMIVLR
ncbi:C39 family peptidase [Candidatus Peregrinibacteria bacterium]|nr:C39 family peptidase [Candidatus Peregrinibacteria bacterium]